MLQWAGKHHQRTGKWPNARSGKVTDAPGEAWGAINTSLVQGGRSLSGGSSLAKLLAEHRGVRNKGDLPNFTVREILQWADKHHQRTGRWPNAKSGKVTDASGETWSAIYASLWKGSRGLSGGSSLAKLLAEHRGVRNRKDLPNLTVREILQWTDKHHQRTGRWPNAKSGKVTDAPGETWSAISTSFWEGSRGLSGGSSLAKLLAEHRGVRNKGDLPNFTVRQILQWTDKHHQRTGRWPNVKSGKVTDAAGETWSAINTSLWKGSRGLSGGSSLAKLLDEKRREKRRGTAVVFPAYINKESHQTHLWTARQSPLSNRNPRPQGSRSVKHL
jgi:hypothetical protein